MNDRQLFAITNPLNGQPDLGPWRTVTPCGCDLVMVVILAVDR